MSETTDPRPGSADAAEPASDPQTGATPPPEDGASDTASDTRDDRSGQGGRGGAIFVLLLLGAVVAAGWLGWQWVQARIDGETQTQAEVRSLAERLEVLEDELASTRGALRQAERRISDAAGSQRVLREELLGIADRAALLESSVAGLDDRRPRQGAELLLRLDEVELLLHIGQQRLQLANDRDGAIRAYTLANQVLSAVDDPAWISLRQSLGQELGALRALDEDPRDLALGALDAFEAALARLPPRLSPAASVAEDDARDAAGFQRLFGQLVRVRRSEDVAVLLPEQRELGLAALRLDLSLARGAVERRDDDTFAAAVDRIDSWLPLLFQSGDRLDQQRARLRDMAAEPLRLEVPVLGSTLDLLRRMRAGAAGAEPDPT